MILAGRNAIVTGSTSGIGLGIATALARAGAGVMLNGIGTPEQIAAAEASVAEAGGRVGYDGADMRKPVEVAAMVRRCEREWGALDILVNNAGIQHVAPIAQFPEERWDAIMAVNLSAAFHATKAAIPAMQARRSGRIINICSAHSLTASPFKSAYVAAKHGLAGFTKAAALELAEHGVTVNAISPGFVLTPLIERQISDLTRARGIAADQAQRELLTRQPTRQFVKVEEIGALAVFLASPAAASITGANYSIDGGWTAE